MRRARYSANLRAAGQMFLGASVFIDARALLAFLPAVGSAIWKLSVIDLSVLVGKRGSCNALAWHWYLRVLAGPVSCRSGKKGSRRLDANFPRGILATPSADGMFIGCCSGERGSIPLLQQRLFKPLSGETGQSVS
jgi:hypothetical protein